LWRGFDVASGPVLLFAAIALVMRTVTLYPVLTRVRGLDARSRRLIVWMGPRGLSSLLLILLPVFAGVPGADELFAITALVVLISVVVHGVGIAIWLRRDSRDRDGRSRIEDEERGRRKEEALAALPRAMEAASPTANGDVITVEEVRARQAAGEHLTVVDARSDRTWSQDGVKAAGAVRIPPGDVVRTARTLGLSNHGTVVVYCA
jgi:sodium/hydrogen antiporter